MSDIQHPLSRAKVNLAELRSNGAFSKFVAALNAHLTELRNEYEDSEASEFTRGKVQAVKDILNHIAEQNIR